MLFDEFFIFDIFPSPSPSLSPDGGVDTVDRKKIFQIRRIPMTPRAMPQHISAIVLTSPSNFSVHSVFSFIAVNESWICIKKIKKKKTCDKREREQKREEKCVAQMFVYSFIYLLPALNKHNAAFTGAECVFLQSEVHFDTILRVILFSAA